MRSIVKFNVDFVLGIIVFVWSDSAYFSALTILAKRYIPASSNFVTKATKAFILSFVVLPILKLSIKHQIHSIYRFLYNYDNSD